MRMLAKRIIGTVAQCGGMEIECKVTAAAGGREGTRQVDFFHLERKIHFRMEINPSSLSH